MLWHKITVLLNHIDKIYYSFARFGLSAHRAGLFELGEIFRL